MVYVSYPGAVSKANVGISNDKEMKIDYPKDYKVQMWICYNYLDEASEEGTYSNVSGDLKFTYHSCRNLYENRVDRSEEDPDMEMLEETMKELE